MQIKWNNQWTPLYKLVLSVLFQIDFWTCKEIFIKSESAVVSTPVECFSLKTCSVTHAFRFSAGGNQRYLYFYLSSSPLSCPLQGLETDRSVRRALRWASVGGGRWKNTLFEQYLFSACLSWEQDRVTSFHLNKQTAEDINENYRLYYVKSLWHFTVKGL